MKRVISIILTIAMIATFAAFGVSADEIATVDASSATGEKSNYTEFTVTKKYFAVEYTMKDYQHEGNAGDNGCCGIVLNGGDSNGCMFIPYDGCTPNNCIKFGPWWPAAAGFEAYNQGQLEVAIDVADGESATLLLLGAVDGENCTYTAYFNGQQINVWGNQQTFTGAFNGTVGWATKLSNSEATVKFVESDTALGADAFASAAPKTGSATAIVAAVAVLALAGTAVASKKH